MFDVAVDVRLGSPTFGRSAQVALSGENLRQLYVPPGFAHGFCVVSDRVHVEYKCTDVYDATDEVTIAWNDPVLAIAWPLAEPVLSAKDRSAKPLAELKDRLPRYLP
jgi:dTDP-4-dehydrorhamnose 3,5-epimerase